MPDTPPMYGNQRLCADAATCDRLRAENEKLKAAPVNQLIVSLRARVAELEELNRAWSLEVTRKDIRVRALEAERDAALRVRPCVARFALEMEHQLARNDHKPGWEHDSANALFERVLDEAYELQGAIMAPKGNVISEAADVANFCMMIADNHSLRARAAQLAEEQG